MFKFKKIYMTLTAFSACAMLSVTAFAVPETAVEAMEPPFAEASSASTENPSETAAEDTAEETTGDDISAYPADVADVPAYETISPPYDPSSGDPPPAADEPREMFSGFETGSGSIDNIKDYWEANGYPEYISFICDQGVASYDVATQTETVYRLWEIGIADISEEKKDEVRSLISSEQHLYFTPCTHSLSSRRQIKSKIEENFPLASVELSGYSENIEVYLHGYDEDEWDKVEAEILAMLGSDSGIVDILKMLPTVGIPEIGIEDTVPAVTIPETLTEIGEETVVASNIDIAPPVTENIISPPLNGEQSDLDGDPNGYSTGTAANDTDKLDTGGYLPSTSAADTTAGKINNPEVSGAMSEIGEVAAMINTESQKDGNSLLIWICAVAAAAAVIITVVILGKRHAVKNVSLADGGELTVGSKATKGEIVKAVKESETVPDDKVFENIMEKIGNKE